MTGDGLVLLVAVDGRRPGYSVGASFEESAVEPAGSLATR